MPKTIISVDLDKGPRDQTTPIHNRWHPDIPPVATVKPGDDFIVECLDWTGGQINNNDNAADISNDGVTIVLVEQGIAFARRESRSFAIMDKGRVVVSGPNDALTCDLIYRHMSV
jgi:hypothetical protein